MKYKELPWVLLILVQNWKGNERYIAEGFSKYSNTFSVFLDFNSPQIKLHHYAGRIYNKISNHKLFSKIVLKIIKGLLFKKYSFKDIKGYCELFDLILIVDPARRKYDLRPFKNAVKAFWAHDCLLKGDYYSQILAGFDELDIVFSAHKECLDLFKPAKTYFLTYCCFPSIHKRLNLSFDYDITFVGSFVGKKKYGRKRDEILKYIQERLSNRYRIFIGNAYYHDMVRLYNRSKIVLNISRLGEINWRTFEVLGCGKFLLNDEGKEVLDLFINKKHLVTFESKEELLELIEYYLKNEEERERIAMQGYEECHEKHTIEQRVIEVLEKALGIKKEILKYE